MCLYGPPGRLRPTPSSMGFLRRRNRRRRASPSSLFETLARYSQMISQAKGAVEIHRLYDKIGTSSKWWLKACCPIAANAIIKPLDEADTTEYQYVYECYLGHYRIEKINWAAIKLRNQRIAQRRSPSRSDCSIPWMLQTPPPKHMQCQRWCTHAENYCVWWEWVFPTKRWDTNCQDSLRGQAKKRFAIELSQDQQHQMTAISISTHAEPDCMHTAAQLQMMREWLPNKRWDKNCQDSVGTTPK